MSEASCDLNRLLDEPDFGEAVEGVSIQEMAAVLEVILGAVADPHFGPYVMFGLGGVYAEILRDVTYRFAPVTNAEAREMVMEIRASQIFEGVRGQPPRDMEALATAIVNLSRVIRGHQDRIAEIEINPLFVGATGAGVVAADSLILSVRLQPAVPYTSTEGLIKVVTPNFS